MENKFNEGGMFSYDFGLKVSNITYGEMKFKFFNIREVYIDGVQKGEYHIQPIIRKDPEFAVLFLKSKFPDAQIGLTDPSGLLNLEYPIYLICKSGSLIMETIKETFEKIDEELDGKGIS